MTRSSKSRKLSDAERHERFIAMAKEVEASEDPKDFDRAFQKITSKQPSHPNQKPKASGGARSTSK
jgi:hypothetical protein